MTAGIPWLGAALAHGPLVASATAFAISPGIPALLARTLERRWLRPKREFAAFIYGDPLLALAVGTGVWLSGDGPSVPVGDNTGGRVVAVAVLAGWLAFGLWQWRAEVRAGVYLRAQAVAPTKIWHQVVTYPALGYLGCSAVVSGLAAPAGTAGTASTAGAVAGKALVIACVLAWSLALAYDQRHPKLGHPPYDWRRLRPAQTPWLSSSSSLLAAAAMDGGTRKGTGN